MSNNVKDYIVLDGNNATYSSPYLYWNIPTSYFKNWQRDDDILIRLNSIQFTFDTGITTNNYQGMAIIETNIVGENYSNSSNKNILGLQSGLYDTQYITPYYNIRNPVQIRTNRFNRIGIAINYNNTNAYANLETDKNLFIAILQIDYLNPNKLD